MSIGIPAGSLTLSVSGFVAGLITATNCDGWIEFVASPGIPGLWARTATCESTADNRSEISFLKSEDPPFNRVGHASLGNLNAVEIFWQELPSLFVTRRWIILMNTLLAGGKLSTCQQGDLR